MFYRFGEYTLNTETKELYRGRISIALERKVFQVLTCLVQHRNRLVTKQELLDTLWPAEFVTESSLTRCIVQARKVLGWVIAARLPNISKLSMGRAIALWQPLANTPLSLQKL